MKLSTFVAPRELHLDRGSLGHLRGFSGERAAVLCGKSSLEQSGELVRVQGLLGSAGLESRVFSGLVGDIDWVTVRELGMRLGEWEPDWIVAIGGGSVLNCAKAAWAAYESAEELPRPGTGDPVGPLRRRARLLAVPTTSGSGAEATNLFLVTDKEAGRKTCVVSPELVPDRVIVDSALTDSLPPSLTAVSGFTALAAAIEAFVSPKSNDVTAALAVRAVQLILRNLHNVYTNGRDREARQAVHVGSTLAGLARSNASAGLCHSFAHVFSARLGLSHGLATALFLVPVMQKSLPTGRGYEDLGTAVGMENREQLLVSIFRLRGQLNLPESVAEAGISAQKVSSSKKTILEAVLKDPCLAGSPRPVSTTDLEEILDLVHYQPEVASCADTSLM